MRRELFLKTLFLAVFLFLFTAFIAVANAQEVVINEVAWMGSSLSTADEWIELRNMSADPIDLTGWEISWDGGLISLSGIISANGYYLLERTDDNSVPGIEADLIFTGSLGNSGEDLLLKDSLGSVIDSAMFSTGWPWGDNSTKQTMERKCLPAGGLDSDWQTSENVNGTPRASNNCQIECIALEISRQCVADSQAEVNYEYNNESCGEDYSEIIADTECACLYSDWVSAECVGDGKRKQTRIEESGFGYCMGELEREVDDDTCLLNNNTIEIAGRGCYLSNNHWQCAEGEVSISDLVISLKIHKIGFDEEFVINKKIDKRNFSIYLAKYHNRRLRVIINNYNGNVFLIGKGVWFLGKVK